MFGFTLEDDSAMALRARKVVHICEEKGGCLRIEIIKIYEQLSTKMTANPLYYLLENARIWFVIFLNLLL